MNRGISVAVFQLLLFTGSLASVEWYHSSASGAPGSVLGQSGPDPEGWSLSVDLSEEKEIRSLYYNGQVQTSTVFYRREGRLMAREELDGQGSLLSRVEYAYDMEGNPRAVYISQGADASGSLYVESDSEVNPEGRFHRHISGEGGDWSITDLNQSGRPVKRRILDSGTVVEESIWNRDGNGILREEIHRTGSEELRSLYDNEGHLIEESTIRDELVILHRSYTWTAGKLTRIEERGEGQIVVRDMEWSGDRIIRESRSVDGIITDQTEWESPKDRVVTFFRDGQAVIRVYWVGGVRKREEFLRDGEVIRVREEGA